MELSKKQDVKIDGQKVKISKLKEENAEIKAKSALKDEELAQMRVQSEALKAEVAQLSASKQEKQNDGKGSGEKDCRQKEGLSDATDEISRLKDLLAETTASKQEVQTSLKQTEKTIETSKAWITRLESMVEECNTKAIKV